MKILGVIPARYASSRFPGKPLAEIRGKTMIKRVYEQAKKSSKLTDVIIATDDKRIAEAAMAFGSEVVLTSTSHLNGTSRCHEALEIKNSQKQDSYDAIINIQGDEPFINPAQIDQVCDILINRNAVVATLAKEIEKAEELFNTNVVKVVFGNKQQALYFSRNPIPFVRSHPKEEWLQQASFYKHIGIYGFSTDILKRIVKMKTGKLEILESLEQLRWLEKGIEIVVGITEFESVGIDTPDDLKNLLTI